MKLSLDEHIGPALAILALNVASIVAMFLAGLPSWLIIPFPILLGGVPMIGDTLTNWLLLGQIVVYSTVFSLGIFGGRGFKIAAIALGVAHLVAGICIWLFPGFLLTGRTFH